MLDHFYAFEAFCIAETRRKLAARDFFRHAIDNLVPCPRRRHILELASQQAHVALVTLLSEASEVAIRCRPGASRRDSESHRLS
ncbi:hypothetical protein [Roseateles violae]|uniref:Uncharacterized protein n=1 Tax=Roseateles violae TaxID=3058042 RepID=A0ABT8DSL7_9BURK|nr:hypothetical protein [Pelomonas sp. PFR6]MDN3920053.1 hypothetical protein [Pelomonas sp. PFR6]